MAPPTIPLLMTFAHVLGAALYVGGTFAILVTNRALRRRMAGADVERRDLVRYLGKAAAPALAGGFLLSALSGLYFWEMRGWTLEGAMPWKLTVAALALVSTAGHIALGRRETRSVALAAALGSLTLLSALGLLFLGAWLRYT